ncbi:glucosamine-6-phosphate deaminase [Bacillus massiliigorillae]|uniref:glucosamine-6-phosphate deaminase n=1 Tax=Bacillus massiliigorillae TaxID=1243664 RepID=UPI00039C88C7|nr:glucosamine-6-phosphate deaminase [Bacillus massiliigorillae]
MTALQSKVNTKVFEIIHAENYEEMSRIAAKRMIGLVKRKPNAVLGLATGSTPEGLYKLLIEDHKENGTSYKGVKTVNLDEYMGLDRNDKNSYFTFMREHLFNHIDVNLDNTNVPNGMATNMEEEAVRYENYIHEIGGVDLQILGIGHNGHIGFNEPGTSFESKTHVIELAERTREANARYFNSMDEVPTHAITMGIQSIMDSEEIILLASGASKAEAIKRLVCGEITEDFPASALRLHSKVTIIADEEALSLI